jgi:hypothetical protein
MQRYELEAWLGDDHGLTDEQIDELLSQVDGIEDRCDGDEDEMREELVTAYRLMVEESADVIIEELSDKRIAAVAAEMNALAGLRQAAITLIGRGDETEAGFARKARVDRMTVRKWLGK